MGTHPDAAKYYRQEWMSDDQWECALMLADLHGGFHHVTGKIKPCGYGIENNAVGGRFATFDFDRLTAAVIMAHDRAIRFEVAPSGPRMIRLYLHRRKREGSMSQRHPTLDEALSSYRAHQKDTGHE